MTAPFVSLFLPSQALKRMLWASRHHSLLDPRTHPCTLCILPGLGWPISLGFLDGPLCPLFPAPASPFLPGPEVKSSPSCSPFSWLLPPPTGSQVSAGLLLPLPTCPLSTRCHCHPRFCRSERVSLTPCGLDWKPGRPSVTPASPPGFLGHASPSCLFPFMPGTLSY